ncbi:hypothetical protein [Methanobrevibacter filiformis]|uniref:Uncharacterized protein n=1 Tax=Methanobrevibacter filiformis TaxID=55758 RepID=A0A166DLP5_9EURY|nr:hypothetical protein [Methanobrevibacter filiformis]KZX15730.1 hypothetical protein MBFIL_05940 [Methanobrevibacter filiformis]
MNSKIIYSIITIVVVIAIVLLAINFLSGDENSYDLKVDYDGNWSGNYNLISNNLNDSDFEEVNNVSGNGTATININKNSSQLIEVHINSKDKLENNTKKKLKASLIKNNGVLTESFTYNLSRGVELIA